MATIEIYGEPTEEKIVRLRLRKSSEGVVLDVVNSAGISQKSLLTITTDGKLRVHNFAEFPGIVTNRDGRIAQIPD